MNMTYQLLRMAILLIEKVGDQTFETYYDEDLSPINEVITVTVKAISESGWTTTSEKEAESSFDVRSTGPCTDPAYV